MQRCGVCGTQVVISVRKAVILVETPALMNAPSTVAYLFFSTLIMAIDYAVRICSWWKDAKPTLLTYDQLQEDTNV